MNNTTTSRFSRHVFKRVPTIRSSRLPALLTSALLMMLVISPLLASGALQPASVAAQDAGDADASISPYNTSAGPIITFPTWTDGSGWSEPGSYETIQLADIDGDGKDELLGRGYHGMVAETWNSTLGLWEPLTTSGPLPNENGWQDPQYASTIQTADIDGEKIDGEKREELLARSSTGIETYKWDGTNWNLIKAENPDWSDAGGWDRVQYYSTIQTADIDGDGAAELLARGAGGMDTYKWSGSEWTLLKSANPDWSDAGGWDQVKYYSTIQTGDIDGEKGDELLARGADGMDTYKWTGSEWKYLKGSSPPWSDAAGWDHPQFYETIQTADIDGDGKAEMLGRAGDGIETFKWNGTAWGHLKSEDPDWSDGAGWDQVKYYATIQTGDIDGDGAAELLGRAADGMETYRWETDQWVRLSNANPELGDDYWDTAKNYATIQTGDVDGDTKTDLVARGRYGVRTWSFNKALPDAWDNPIAFGFPAFTGVELDAYNFINEYLTLGQGQVIRDQYSTSGTRLGRYQDCLFDGNNWTNWTALPTESCGKFGSPEPIRPPSTLTLAAWNNVGQQIWDELGQASTASTYFADLADLYGKIFSQDATILTSTAQTLYGESMAEQSADALFQNLFLAPFALSSLGGDVAAAVGGLLGALSNAALDASGGTSFQGKWSEASKHFANLSETNQSFITSSRAVVASDASLMAFVAQETSSGDWDPSSAWVTRTLTSSGRMQTALWIYQTLSPSVWQLQVMYYAMDDQCESWGDFIQYYFVNDNANHDCVREVVTNDINRDIAPAEPLHTIMDPVSSSCTPVRTGPDPNEFTGDWIYGNCSLGIPKTDFFLNRDGWKFSTFPLCESVEGCDPSSTAVAADVAPGDPDNTIDLNHQGSVDVALLGSAEFDATSTDHSSLIFAGASPVGWWVDQDDWHPTRIRDVNGDGYLDAVASFAISDLQLTGGETTALLTGSSDTTRFRLELPVLVLPAH